MKNITIAYLVLISCSAFSQHILEKDLDNFNKVKVFDLIEVNLIHSDENKVLIKGDNVDDIQIVNKNGLLKIRMKLDKIFQGEDTFIEVHYKKLDLIDGNEGARITSNEIIKQSAIELKAQEGAKIKVGLDVGFANVKAVTGGIIEASGIAKSQEVVINTGGIFEGQSLRTEVLSVRITAGGEAEVYVTERIDVSVKAGGDVDVYGTPKEVFKKTTAGGRINIIN